MFLHMFYNSVNISEESYMTQLIYLIMSDRLHTHCASDILQVRICHSFVVPRIWARRSVVLLRVLP